MGRAADITDVIEVEKKTVCNSTEMKKKKQKRRNAVTGRIFLYLHQSKVKGDAEGMREMAYRAPICNTVINMTFFQTIIVPGFGPAFSLYV